jgi:rod shape-determining protein MreC
MRDRTRFALKQILTIILLVGTLAFRVLPAGLLDAPRALLLGAVCPAASPLYFFFGALMDAPGAFFGGSSEALETEVRQLTAQLAAKESELQRARRELEALKGFKSLPISSEFFAYSGELTGYMCAGDSSVFSRSYCINLGRRDGVEKGCPVVWGRFAVGMISESASSYSRVRVLGDGNLLVAVRFADSRHQGVLIGSGKQECPVRFVSNRVADGDIKIGSLVLTSGADGVFPPDLVVGKVTRFFRRPSSPSAEVEVVLAIDFSRIESCVVLENKVPRGLIQE